MKISIWGSYEYGNYGDDLMAVIYGITAKKLECTTYIYRLADSISDEFGFISTESMDELFNETNMLLIGGGGMLIDIPIIKWLGSRYRNFELDYRALYKQIVKKKHLNLISLSVGGSGIGTKTSIGLWRKKIFSKYSNLITLRNKEDEELLVKLGSSFKYIPDVVLSTSKFFPSKKQSTTKRIIGVNLHKRNANEINLIRNIVPAHIDINYFTTHLDDSVSNYEFIPDQLKTNEYVTRYRSIKEYVEEVSKLELLVTSKLHVGVTALSYGIPILSVGAKKKTHSFLRGINSNAAFTSDFSKVISEYVTNGISEINKLFDWNEIEKQKEESFKHIDILENKIESITNG